MEQNNTTCCLVFTKNPIPGKTKTRLIPALGINGAYEVHLKLLKNTLSIISNIKNIDFLLYHTTCNDNKIIPKLAYQYNVQTRIQRGDNLGDKMYFASQESLINYSHCIIIGIDCPEISDEYISDAKKTLSSGYDAVIGPAHDGGYVLIGFNTALEEVFSNISWGKNTVLSQTLQNFKKLNLKYKELPTLHDVDTKEDLQYLNLI